MPGGGEDADGGAPAGAVALPGSCWPANALHPEAMSSATAVTAMIASKRSALKGPTNLILTFAPIRPPHAKPILLFC